MNIPSAFWGFYTSELRKINDKAVELVRKFLEVHSVPQTKAEMDALIDYAFKVSTKYGEAASAAAANMYDAIAKASKATVKSAITADVPEISEVAKAVVGTSKTGNPDIIADSVGRLVKRTGVDTTMQNAIRDGAEWAWIPMGDTCAFCIMLASNGWQRASKKALKGGHAEHIHANCDCTYAIRFNSSTEVVGYDPDRYREMYDNADGTTWGQKVNSMRRDFYEEHAEEINEQKRDNYEKRKERESSAAEELDV